jgi:HSP20 family protein
MANLTRRDNGNRTLQSRDPFAFARELFSWDPFGDLGRNLPQTFAPRFEVKERPDAYVFRADMPGVKEEDLDISLQNGVLTISGSRSAEEKQEGETYYLYERSYGSFSRSFALPESADAEKVEARLHNGELYLTIGKRQEARPRKIELKRT